MGSLDPTATSEAVIMHHPLTKVSTHQAFENTSTNVAASQMRNALNNLAESCNDPAEKKRFEAEMDNFFALFRRYLNDKAKGNSIDWSKINPPAPEQVVNYDKLPNREKGAGDRPTMAAAADTTMPLSTAPAHKATQDSTSIPVTAASTSLSPTTTSGASEGTFNLLLFASASTFCNNLESLSLPAPTTLPQLFNTLESHFPGIKKKVLRSSAITVNLEYVDFEVDSEGSVTKVGGVEGKEDGDVVIRRGDEVGVVPPVSSG
ncbi:putative UTP--glucose-1-phosphate uridylyltransferase [Cyphellophora attinorum]|uniref:Putative UTP--glucose-1-phosphate uridylyltransferase n=1 Tax=Cyphellophora attinorum TaxID=1664694 RepID=A0A0N0NPM5_9EURO|nr:putative UTP--glucose-1-phosphate uridylyltransferase [Phialophora attinorum]KPI42719.1 putative UTP--glucose-1-phosphate uridylyltransferase [Phialophora attinorum]